MFLIFSSIAVLAPLQNLAPLISIPMQLNFSFFEAIYKLYSPLPQPSSNINGLLFLKYFFFQFPFMSNKSLFKTDLLG